MFYAHEILKKRGKFGLAWLAATSKKRLNRRDIFSADVEEMSEDVISVLQEHKLGDKKCLLSLYTSSQLMFGLAYLNSRQTSILFEDVRCFVGRFADFKCQDLVNVDLVKPVDKAKVTLEEPVMEDAPLDFGYLKPIPEPSDFYHFLDIYSPRSEPGLPIALPVIEPLPDRFETLNQSRHEDITMIEPVAMHSEEPLPMEMPEDHVDMLAAPLSFLSPTSSPPPVEQIPRLHYGEEELFFTSSPPPDAPMDVQAGLIAPPLIPIPTVESTGFPVPVDATPPEATSSIDTFILAPAVPPAKRRRLKRCYLLIDQFTALSSNQLRNNIRVANNRLTLTMHIPSVLESAETMLQRPGLRIVPKKIRKHFQHLATSSEPNYSIFGDVDLLPDDVTVPHLKQELTSENVELQRDREADVHEDTAGPMVSGMFKSLTKTPSFIGQEAPVGPFSEDHIQIEFQDLGLDQGDFDPVRQMDFQLLLEDPVGNLQDLPLPARQDVEMLDADATVFYGADFLPVETATRASLSGVDMVSPSLVGPPPSPIGPFTPDLEVTMDLMREAGSESVFPNLTTFSAVLEKTDKTRKNVALQFNHLIHLHARGKVIATQAAPNEEIYIQIRSAEPLHI